MEAGPDIDVCYGGIVTLEGRIGGKANRAMWRGGKGEFKPGRNSLNIEYTPHEDEKGKPIMLMLVADNPNLNCPAARSEIWINVNEQPDVNAGLDFSVCSGKEINLIPSIHGKYKSVRWSVAGNGEFNDRFIANAIYRPSGLDAAKPELDFIIEVEPLGVCLKVEDHVKVKILNAPEIIMKEEILASGKKSVKLNPIVKHAASVSWTTDGKGTFSSENMAITEYFPSNEDLTRAYAELSLQVFSANCSIFKKVKVFFSSE